jgi:hypothetical protein
LEQCPRFNLILQEYPDHKEDLRHQQQQIKESKPMLKRA